MDITVTFKEGLKKKYLKGITLLEIAKEQNNSPVFAAKIDNVLIDLNTKLEHDCTIHFLDFQDDEGKEIVRH
ncbi:MAG: TGS domain-containing protein, partial [bacterium]